MAGYGYFGRRVAAGAKTKAGRLDPESGCGVRERNAGNERAADTETTRRMARVLEHAANAISAAENKLTELDRAVGDGDLGHNLERAAAAIREAIPFLPLDDPAALLKQSDGNCSTCSEARRDRSTGCFFCAPEVRSKQLRRAIQKAWAAAMLDGADAVAELGGARLGDSTMLDALIPLPEHGWTA